MSLIINRRVFFKVAATGVSGCMISPIELFSQGAAPPRVNILGTAKYCIFVLLGGAPSQIDTFDLKVGPWTPENFNPSTVQGVNWPSGLLPSLGTQLAKNRISVVRSCQAPALVHSLLQTWTQTGRSPANATGQIAPNMGSIIALEKEGERQLNHPVPGFLTMNVGNIVAGPGYLPGRYSAFDGTPGVSGLPNLPSNISGNEPGVVWSSAPATFNARYSLLRLLDEHLSRNSAVAPKFEEMSDFYGSARAMMLDGRVATAFRPSTEDSRRYGTGTSSTQFGNACVAARNLLQADLGVRFVQINLGGWDHHGDIHNPTTGMSPLARQLDTGLGNLIQDLSEMPGSRGSLLDDTLIIARGEFGRTVGPLNAVAGRDHYFNYSALVAGGGTRGGRALGSTTPDGAFVDDPGWSHGRPIYSEDFVATIYSALGINYRTRRTDDPLGLGFEYVATTNTAYIGEPLAELFS
jgi:uncharacterized protein (DUF1501 family)